ncbi:MAG: hypothetical protein ACJAVL_000755 [Bacteroidia bacterium]|jgi:hypothetical protein
MARQALKRYFGLAKNLCYNYEKMKFTQDELKGIGQKLSNPEGEFGLEITKKMNESNIQMTIDSIKSLNLFKSDILLEIGHGNCGHLEKIHNETNDVKYFGL